jgi:peptidoglycan/xylan/chitin deacetylase (PgdA/CDA1 family)
LKREFAYFSGYARLNQWRIGGAGVILRFERVRPAQSGRFQPLKSREITPAFLERLLRALRRWKFDVVPIDEVCRRASQPRSGRRFVCLTFDGGYQDVMTSAYPVLSRYQAPFTVYLPTAFPDGLGEAWWLALEQIIAQHERISLVMDRTERHFGIAAVSEKIQLYDFLDGWMRKLPPPDLTVAINDLCRRYSVDLASLSRGAAMGWDDIARLAGDPLVTIGSATVNYPVLANLKTAAALREMTMGRAVLQAALGRDPRHFAYPFGYRGSYGRQHRLMAADAGFASAVSATPGVVWPQDRSDLQALPRIAWDGRNRSLRAMRVMLSGMMIE